jgi:SOS response associated peptidase (SRAP)
VSTFHARADTISEKPAFRGAWKAGRRCLVITDDFYEWRKKRDAQSQKGDDDDEFSRNALPECGSEDRPDIQAMNWIRVCDDGFGDVVPNCGGHEHQPMSSAICRA